MVKENSRIFVEAEWTLRKRAASYETSAASKNIHLVLARICSVFYGIRNLVALPFSELFNLLVAFLDTCGCDVKDSSGVKQLLIRNVSLWNGEMTWTQG